MQARAVSVISNTGTTTEITLRSISTGTKLPRQSSAPCLGGSDSPRGVNSSGRMTWLKIDVPDLKLPCAPEGKQAQRITYDPYFARTGRSSSWASNSHLEDYDKKQPSPEGLDLAVQQEPSSMVEQSLPRDDDNTVLRLQAAWGWVHDYATSDPDAPYIVTFKRDLLLAGLPSGPCVIHLTVDTRYKLSVNGHHASIGPARGTDRFWFYDTLDIRPFLMEGKNEIVVRVLRYPYSFPGAFTHARTIKPGLSLVADNADCEISTNRDGWECRVETEVEVQQRLPFDIFLHHFETVNVKDTVEGEGWTRFRPYNVDTAFGISLPWKLRPRSIPLPERTPVAGPRVRFTDSTIPHDDWQAFFANDVPVTLPPSTSHRLELEYACHSTAFVKLTAKMLQAQCKALAPRSSLNMTYSEAYEGVERRPGNLASKNVRDQREGHCHRGPHDEYNFNGDTALVQVYEPFWWRTFRYIVFEIDVGDIGRDGLTLLKFEATQTNYPLRVKAEWDLGDREVARESSKLWDVSVRTLRNCAFDGYSDCPFYEQLQYCQDTRSSALFHYCLSGDDRLAKQAIDAFASSMLPDGLIQARYPAQGEQVITGFSLFWILQICDNLLYFNDIPFAKRYLSEIDAVLDFFDRHIGPHGLVEGLPADHWLFVDWVESWESPKHGFSPGVPLAGRRNGIFTYFSMLYAYVLAEAADLAIACGRPGIADEYKARRQLLIDAIRQHCFDGQFFTDSLKPVQDPDLHVYSQHCQVWGVLCGAVTGGRDEEERILLESFYPVSGTFAWSRNFSICSYPMWFYAYRAFSKVGIYNQIFDRSLKPWRVMLGNHLTTWEEDPVTRRSDCHAWSCTYLFEAMTEIAGLKPVAAGWKVISFAPRVALSSRLRARFPLGPEQLAEVDWSTGANGSTCVTLRLRIAADVRAVLPDGSIRENRQVTQVEFKC